MFRANDVPRCRGPRRICKAVSAAGIKEYVQEECAILGIRADRAFVERCVNAGPLEASTLVHQRYKHERGSLARQVQEAVDNDEAPQDTAASLARWAPGALHRLKARPGA